MDEAFSTFGYAAKSWTLDSRLPQRQGESKELRIDSLVLRRAGLSSGWPAVHQVTARFQCASLHKKMTDYLIDQWPPACILAAAYSPEWVVVKDVQGASAPLEQHEEKVKKTPVRLCAFLCTGPASAFATFPFPHVTYLYARSVDQWRACTLPHCVCSSLRVVRPPVAQPKFAVLGCINHADLPACITRLWGKYLVSSKARFVHLPNV